MQLISTPAQLQSQFLSLMDQYERYYWSAAWAGIDNAPFRRLLAHRQKIGHIVIGIHFYQTHPDFMEAFRDDAKVHYRMQADGTFHPKLYLFENGPRDWALLTGSANFTTQAFSVNTEATLLVTSDDKSTGDLYTNAKRFLSDTWNEGVPFKDISFDKYKIRWKMNRERLRGLGGDFGTQAKKQTPPHAIPIMNWTWDRYVAEIEHKETHGVRERLHMLDQVQVYLRRHEHFADIPMEARKFIAGLPNKARGGSDWAVFGSMIGNGVFRKLIANNNPDISAALDHIPLSGEVFEEQYRQFVAQFQEAFRGTRLDDANNLATATRLLAMKRPDIFICYDDANEAGICRDFQLKKSGMNFQTYWTDIIGRIQQCVWYIEPTPRNPTEERLRGARAAFLDSLYYVPKKKKK